MSRNGVATVSVSPKPSEEIIKLFENLSESEQQRAFEQLWSNRITLAFNEDIDRFLETLPPGAIGELLKAIGEYVSRHQI